LLLSAPSTPAPDVIALAATVNNNGIVDIPSPTATGIFSVASVNLGAGGQITVSADTGTTTAPIGVTLCETNPVSGQCVSGIGPSVTTTIDPGATPTFGIFVTANGDVPFAPAVNRVFVRFRDGGGVIRGSTSVAVRTLPDIRGLFQGSGTLTQSVCTDPVNNGTFGATVSFNITNQSDGSFSGSGSAVVGNTVDDLTFAGTVSPSGGVTGTLTFNSFVAGFFAGSGNGSLSGQLSGNTLTLNFSGGFQVGETCVINGVFQLTR
jgi:hypothetical protein